MISLGIALYLSFTANALVYTVIHRSLLPTPVIRYFYGMMAPYQGYSTYNVELVAEGKKADGSWDTIDLLPYFPGSTGERTFREFLLSHRVRGQEVTQRGYERMAEQLREKESKHGRPYAAVRLIFEMWPVSPDGYESFRLPAFTERRDPLTLQ